MKKIIALAIAIMMLAVLAVPAFAAATEANLEANGATANVTATYTVSGGFTVVIPADFNLTEAAEGVEKTISVQDGSKLAIGQTLTVALTATNSNENKWYVAATSGDKVEFTINEGAITPTNNTVLTWAAGADEPSATLTFKIPTPGNKAGTYTSSLTFTVNVADAA